MAENYRAKFKCRRWRVTWLQKREAIHKKWAIERIIRRFGISLRVFTSIFHKWKQRMSELFRNSKTEGRSNDSPNTCFFVLLFCFFVFFTIEANLGAGWIFFFNEAINNFSEVQLAATCILSCFGSQAPPIPRQTILWSKLKKLLVFCQTITGPFLRVNNSLTIKLQKHNIRYIDNFGK